MPNSPRNGKNTFDFHQTKREPWISLMNTVALHQGSKNDNITPP